MLYRFVLIGSLVVLIGCAKRQKNIFVFSSPQTVTVSMFDIPVVRGVTVNAVHGAGIIRWQPIIEPIQFPQGIVFKGYAVYRITQSGVIRKKPINKHPLYEAYYEDHFGKGMPPRGYVVRALFGNDKNIFSGPTSRLVSMPILPLSK